MKRSSTEEADNLKQKSNDLYKIRNRINKTVMRVFLILTSLIVIYPILWNIIASLKSNTEILQSPWSLPHKLNFQNYVNAFTKAKMGDYILNSVFVVALSLVLLMGIVVPMSYSISRFKFRFSGAIRTVYMACIFIQANLIIVPLYMTMQKYHMLDSRIWLSLVYAVFQFPFSVFLLTGFMKTIPKDYENAAMIDGCTYFQILIKIIIPLSRPSITTVAMLGTFSFLSEYPLALTMLTTDSKKTLPVGLANLFEVQRYATDWGALFAGLVIILLPTILIYLFAQNRLTQGMSVGGLKG